MGRGSSGEGLRKTPDLKHGGKKKGSREGFETLEKKYQWLFFFVFEKSS
jgi:hypothetical protein